MKKWIFSLLCLALANSAWAQSGFTVQPAPGPGPFVTPANPPGTVVGQPVSFATHGSYCAPGCASCNPVKTVCAPEPATRIRVSILYSSLCEKVCYPKAYCALGGKSCEPCGQPGYDCGQPYTKRYLVKKYCEQEETVNRCVPVTVPACDTNRFARPTAPGAYYAEPIPGTPTPLKK